MKIKSIHNSFSKVQETKRNWQQDSQTNEHEFYWRRTLRGNSRSKRKAKRGSKGKTRKRRRYANKSTKVLYQRTCSSISMKTRPLCGTLEPPGVSVSLCIISVLSISYEKMGWKQYSDVVLMSMLMMVWKIADKGFDSDGFDSDRADRKH